MVERFIKYCKVDTASDPESETYPSSDCQIEFGKEVAKEMRELGLKDAEIDEYGYIMATIPSNVDYDVPTIGFIAHMDIISSVPTENITPKIVKNYDGTDLVLNEDGFTISVEEYPVLKNYIGQDIITTDGRTLLGADDKAGMVEILALAEYLLANPEIKHGEIKIGFTPDEEIGQGTKYFDVKKFGADFAYTVDGGQVGSLNYETFNAATAKIKINGTNIHPGSAKGKMVSAILLSMELNSLLPEEQKPAYTEEYEGFFHLNWVKGNVDKAEMNYIIRDHDRDKFNDKKELMKNAVEFMNKKYNDRIELDLTDSYKNMSEKIEPVMHIINTAKKAMENLGIEPLINPVRGGTDGARLSYKGLPCPNIFTGGHNAHGKSEFVPVQSMEKAVQVMLEIVRLYTEK
ncbi:MAG: peptidase T [Clostridia bacterium]